jgi:hypothetical protein
LAPRVESANREAACRARTPISSMSASTFTGSAVEKLLRLAFIAPSRHSVEAAITQASFAVAVKAA